MGIALAPFTIRGTVFAKEDVESTYKRLHDLGFDGLEGGLGRRFGYSVEEDMALLNKHKLIVCDMWGDATKPDEAMKAAEAYGTNIVCVQSVPDEMLRSADGFKAFCKQLNETAKPFKAAGFKLSYHNHSQEFRNFSSENGKPGMEILISETDPDAVVFCMDTFWIAAAGADPAYWIKRVKGRATVVHFKDYAIDDVSYDLGMGSIPWRFAEIGQGNINWKSVLEACKEIGIEWYCIEQDQNRGDCYASLKTSIDYMRNELKIK